MSLFTSGGKLLINSSKLATSAACCCSNACGGCGKLYGTSVSARIITEVVAFPFYGTKYPCMEDIFGNPYTPNDFYISQYGTVSDCLRSLNGTDDDGRSVNGTVYISNVSGCKLVFSCDVEIFCLCGGADAAWDYTDGITSYSTTYYKFSYLQLSPPTYNVDCKYATTMIPVPTPSTGYSHYATAKIDITVVLS